MTATRYLELNHDNAPLRGSLVVPDGLDGPAPAVMVMHSGMGLGEFYIEKARELAKLGYVGLAADMYGNGFHTQVPEEAGSHFAALLNDPALLRARVVAWYETLAALPEVDATRVAAIGYCFGGRCVLELARSGADVRAVVSYHGLLTTSAPAAPGSVKGVVAVYTGSMDPYAPRQDVEALRGEMAAAAANLHLTEFSGAYHSFTTPNPPRGVEEGMQYDELCANLSWAGTLALLECVFRPMT